MKARSLAAWFLAGIVALPLALAGPARALAGTFASEIERLSEPEGSFDTDNLISNERMYLRVIPDLVAHGVSGGAYIGVGPDQNFSYIARIRPSVAYIVDLRRDNLLLHLLFKALFAKSRTRVEYLSLLVGRAPPADLAPWKTASIGAIIAAVDKAGAPSPAAVAALRRQVDDVVTGFGARLTSADLRTIDEFHRAFIADGLDLQFHTFGRPPQPFYPKLRDLLAATDAAGHAWNYLAAEDDFQFVKALEGRDGVIPVVGNLAGPHAMRAVAEDIAARGLSVSAFYVSNVETYLYAGDTYQRFADNVRRLPRDTHSVLIRSVFTGGGASTSEIDAIDTLAPRPLRGRVR